MTAPTIEAPMPDTISETPYDDTLDAGAALTAAFERASATGKRVVVNFGANWCPDARALCAMLAMPALNAFMLRHFEIVTINVGRYDSNMDLVAQLGLTEGLEGIPTVLIAEADQTLINLDIATRWRTARDATPQEIVDYFAPFATADEAS